MMEKKRSAGAVGFIISLIVLVFIITDIAYSCSCIKEASPVIELSQSKVVFIGKVIKIYKSKDNNIINIKFKLLKSYKGVSGKFVWINTYAQGGAACGVTFIENEEYLIYAYYLKGKLHTNICTRTKKLSEAEEDLEALKLLESSSTPK